MLGRRDLLTGLFGLIAAPAVVRATSIMTVSAPLIVPHRPLFQDGDLLYNGIIIREIS